MTDELNEQVAKIQEALPYVTDGPWIIAAAEDFEDSEDAHKYGIVATLELDEQYGPPDTPDEWAYHVVSPAPDTARGGTLADARFIALSRQVVPALLAEVERLRTDNERLRAFATEFIEASEDTWDEPLAGWMEEGAERARSALGESRA